MKPNGHQMKSLFPIFIISVFLSYKILILIDHVTYM